MYLYLRGSGSGLVLGVFTAVKSSLRDSVSDMTDFGTARGDIAGESITKADKSRGGGLGANE